MARVHVRNLNDHPFEQKFRDVLIRIPAKETVEMDEEDASQFLGTMFRPKIDNKGNHDPKYFKMLRIEKDKQTMVSSADPLKGKFACTACKEQTSSWVELEAHMRLMHQDNILRDEEYEKFKESQKKVESGAKQAAGSPAKP